MVDGAGECEGSGAGLGEVGGAGDFAGEGVVRRSAYNTRIIGLVFGLILFSRNLAGFERPGQRSGSLHDSCCLCIMFLLKEINFSIKVLLQNDIESLFII